jgi:hypothetical protein
VKFLPEYADKYMEKIAMAYSRAITRIAPQTRPTKPLAPAQRFGLRQRINVADRLFGANGALPNTRLTEILNHPILNGRNMAETIREVMTFARDNHEATAEVLSDVVREVEALSREEALAQAQEVVGRHYQEKIAQSNDAAMKESHPKAPTIQEFAAMEPNGHFDPYQYIASVSWGAISMRIDFGRMCGFEKAMSDFSLRSSVRDAMIMTRAFEIL